MEEPTGEFVSWIEESKGPETGVKEGEDGQTDAPLGLQLQPGQLCLVSIWMQKARFLPV